MWAVDVLCIVQLSADRKLKLPAARDEEEKTDASGQQSQGAGFRVVTVTLSTISCAP